MEIFGVSLPGLLSQLLLGLVNGSFYAILSLGLAVIFGLLNVINFAHGALFMMGALMTWMAMNYLGINYWLMLVLASLVVCVSTWYVIEKTKLGAYLRAGTENPRLVEAFGINVPVMVTLTYAFGAALAAFAGVLAAPVYQVSPLMGQNLIIVVFAVVVIGGMGSIMGSILTGLGLGVIEGFTKVFYPEASSTVVFVIMVIVLLIRPAGLFGKEK